MFQEQIRIEALKDCNRLYQNFFFLVIKENGKYWLINTAVFLNKILIKNTNLLPSANEFLEDFSGIAIVSIVNLFSDYD